MQILGMDGSRIGEAGATWTAREIAQQPATWREVAAGEAVGAAARYVAGLLGRPGLRVILTGAGSSAFVGECLAPSIATRWGGRVEAIATTDLVAAPGTVLDAGTPTLLVSFARSGNSPESVAAVDLAQSLARECHHLIVTCNAEGLLARRGACLESAQVLLLPPQCNDQGFAMTSSFSTMLLAAALAFGVLPRDAVDGISAGASAVLESSLPLLEQLVADGHERVVFLGAAQAKGLAREAALKLLELTDGRVVAISDTPMGFRHGPKTIVNGRTLVVLFSAADPHTRRYDEDLLAELRRDRVAGRVLELQPATPAPRSATGTAQSLALDAGALAGPLGTCLPMLVFAQAYAMLRAIAIGNTPDNPNAAGTVNRVVRGVIIHPWAPAP
jgi:tagatose-6-phosphate ketose/aldose isomerase